MVASQTEDKRSIGWELRIKSETEDVVEGIYNYCVAKKQIHIFTANNADMIRDALKEAEKNRRNYGIQTKLYLRVQSMQQIEGMTEKQVAYLMNDIMENIVYSDDFPATQKKWNVQEMAVKSPYNYEQRKEKWQQKVGIKWELFSHFLTLKT